MGESWIVSNLNAALSTWNDKLAEIWSLLTESPQTFNYAGKIWRRLHYIRATQQAQVLNPDTRDDLTKNHPLTAHGDTTNSSKYP